MSLSAIPLLEFTVIVTSNDLYFPGAFILIASTVRTAILPSNGVKQSNESVIYWASWFRDWFYTATASHLLSELFVRGLPVGFITHLPSTKEAYDMMLLIINNLILIVVLHFLIDCLHSFAFSYL